jgi:hypothetical protein
MTRQALICRVVEMMIDDIELLKKKNADYSPESDALENFRDFGAAGVIVRIGDKYKRAKTWAKRGDLKISDEGIKDTLRDMGNYCYLARVLLEE